MKRFLILICAVAALVCSCDKYGATLDDLGERIEAQYQTATKLLSQVDAMALLAQAKEAQMKIVSVTYDETSMTVTFSDGTKYIIEQGKESGIVATESDEYWTFAFGDESLDLLKEFLINLDVESVEVPATNSAEITYTLQAGGETTFVTAKGYGINVVAVDQENNTITIQAGRKPGEASLLISAIRNFDCKVVEKLVPIEITPRQNPKIAFDGANSGYYGQEYSVGSDNYYTQFWKGEVDENNYFVGEAYSVILDMYAPISDILAIPAGEYRCAYDVTEFTFMVGKYGPTLREQIEDNLALYQYFFGLDTVEEIAEFLGYSLDELDMPQFESGSELYHQFEDGTYEDLAITDGTVKVELNGSSYKVTMNLVADFSDWEFTYEGEIPVEDHTSDGGGDDPGAEWDTIVADCWGDYYYEGVQEWIVEIYKSANGDDEEFITLDILAPMDATDYIPSGIYTVSDSEEAFTVLPGEYYTWWQKYGFCWDEASEGTLEIINEGDGVYTFIMDFTDIYYGDDWGITITAPVRGLSKTPEKLQPGKPERKDMLGDKISTTPKDFGKAKYFYEGHRQGHKNPHVPFVYFK